MNKESKFKNRIKLLKLNYKIEITKLIFFPLLIIITGLILSLILSNFTYLLGLSLIGLFFDIVIVNNYKTKENEISEEHEDEFINLFTYFQVFSNNGYNVYKSLSLCRDFSSAWMKDKINFLLEQIDKDKTVLPFVNFAKNFKNISYENIVLTLFQIVDDGEGKLFYHKFNLLFEKINKEHELYLIDKKKKDLDIINSFPIFGAALITILLTFGILSMIGELINGI